MIPIRDNVPSQTHPIFNILIILICGFVFFLQMTSRTSPDELDPVAQQFGMIPLRVLHPGEMIVIRHEVPVQTFFGVRTVTQMETLEPTPFPPILTLLTCIFLHGGFLHFLGNMWFLWIFGDNVEDRLGHVHFLLFYLGCGVFASLAHLVTNPGSPIPTVGASGAIAGVMGAYFLLYPRAQVLTMVPVFLFLYMVTIPAPVFLGIWFMIQFLQGTIADTTPLAGGVAWWAHIGGFVAGMVWVTIARHTGHLRPARPYRHVRRSYRYHLHP